MRKLFISILAALAAFLAAPAVAADIPEYEIKIPDVDYGLGDSFYLRGSAALNVHWAADVRHPLDDIDPIAIDSLGYGYSWGVGFGYETGTGLRYDVTIDTLETQGLGITKDSIPDHEDGKYTLMLRSTIAMANAYYDFSFGGFGGGAFGYVGGGVGLAYNHAEVNVSENNVYVPTGGNVSPTAAIMAGVGYDMGSWVMDVGYRGLWIHEVNNAPTTEATSYYEIDNNLVHELRGTVRYRFN